MSDKADRAEMAMYKKTLRLLQSYKSKSIVSPAGSATTFPDFGIEVMMAGKKIHLHIEFKESLKEQMGSLRSWIFDGSKYSISKERMERAKLDMREHVENPSYMKKLEQAQEDYSTADELIQIMNSSRECISGGRKVLSEMKKLINPNIKKIWSGMFGDNTFKDTSKQGKFNNLIKYYRYNTKQKNVKGLLISQYVKRYKTKPSKNHVLNTGGSGYEIAEIQDSSLGKKLIHHYSEKFKKSEADFSTNADHCLLMIIMGDDIWFIQEGHKKMSAHDRKIVLTDLGRALCRDNMLPTIEKIQAQLEVRIQPRHMEAKLISSTEFQCISKDTPSLDVMASFRMLGINPTGAKVK